MSLEVRITRKGNAFVPADAISNEELDSIRNGEVVAAKITRPRNIKHHRKFFALIQEVFSNQERYATLSALLDAIKIGIGHFDWCEDLFGRPFPKPRSISFAKADQHDFEQFYNKTIDLIITEILPGTDREDLKNRIEEIIAGNNQHGEYVHEKF